MAAAASHFIDLIDGEPHVLPSEAKDIVVVIKHASHGGAHKLRHGIDADLSVQHTYDEINLSDGINHINVPLLLHVQLIAANGTFSVARIYYGV